MIRKLFGSKDRKLLVNITLDNIQNKMYEMDFYKEFVEEIMIILENRFNKYGKKEFQEWFDGLNYRLPEEFNDEKVAIKIYEKHSFFIEEQVKKLEQETKLNWEIQTEDLKNSDEKVRKVQLVIRHRLSDIALDLLS
jgi:anaerobic ribonucleoside-triphosphate reductase